MVNEFQPYVGPRPFEREDSDLFFGRDREIRDLKSLVTAHQVVLFYAQSGAGKTSLLNAGLIPVFEEDEFEVFPLARVRSMDPEERQIDQPSNIYIFNTFLSWTKDEFDSKRLIQMSLANFLKEREHLVDEDGISSFRVIIFDQFEELFLFYPERWKERENFFRQVSEALEEDHLLRVLFVIREEYLASMDPYLDYFPERLRIRYRLERLRQKTACLAVEEPLKNTEYSFAEGVVSNLVDQLLKIRVKNFRGETIETTGEFVEPVQLQVVCQNLWLNLPSNITIITSQHVQQFGDVDEALKDFYEETLEKVKNESGVKEKDLRKWFEVELITPFGTRGTVVRDMQQTGGISNSVVDELEKQHIIRAEMRAGARWYELTHDCFIDPIRKSNEAWLTKRSILLNSILVSVFLFLSLTLLVFLRFNIVKYDVPVNLLVLFFSVIYLPLLIKIFIYFWRYPVVTKANGIKKSWLLSRIILSIVLIYITYGFFSFLFYTEVRIESAKFLKEITFTNKSSFLPFLPNKHKQIFQLEVAQADTSQSLIGTYAYKQLDKDQPIRIPWGNYEIRYTYWAYTAIDTMKLVWNFKSFRQVLPLL